MWVLSKEALLFYWVSTKCQRAWGRLSGKWSPELPWLRLCHPMSPRSSTRVSNQPKAAYWWSGSVSQMWIIKRGLSKPFFTIVLPWLLGISSWVSEVESSLYTQHQAHLLFTLSIETHKGGLKCREPWGCLVWRELRKAVILVLCTQ